MERNPNSLLVWFPKVAALRLPHPKTTWVDVGWEALQGLLDGKPLPANKAATILAVARAIGFPLFMRTDLISAKHQWRDTCYVATPEELIPHIGALVEAESCLFLRDGPSTAIVLREYVELFALFHAFNGLPIARERRYFVEGGKVLCHHSYWPEEAIKDAFHVDQLPQNWKTLLLAVNNGMPGEHAELTAYAEAVSAALPGAWSVDFAYSAAGKWLLIDMATAAQSWHPEDCPTQRKETPE